MNSRMTERINNQTHGSKIVNIHYDRQIVSVKLGDGNCFSTNIPYLGASDLVTLNDRERVIEVRRDDMLMAKISYPGGNYESRGRYEL